MTDQRECPRSANGDRKGHLELAVSQIRPAGTNDVSKVIGDSHVLAVIHAHSDQQLGPLVNLEFPSQVVVFQ